LKAVNTNVTMTPEDIVPSVNTWLGRSSFNVDNLFVGSMNEFRTYNGAVAPLQIAVDTATGPDTIVTDPGVCNSISITANSPMGQGDQQQADARQPVQPFPCAEILIHSPRPNHPKTGCGETGPTAGLTPQSSHGAAVRRETSASPPAFR